MIKKNKTYTIGIDIGGTNMKAVLFDGEKVIFDFSLATPKDDKRQFMIMLNALVEPLLDKAKEMKVKVAGVGLGVAGVIDYAENRILESPNIPMLNGLKLAKEAEELLGLPVTIDNDGNCFVRAEVCKGAAKKFDNVYGIIIGTGIGGGWCVNKEVYRAAHGGSGEPGEMIVDFSEGTGLEKAYHKLTQGNPSSMAEEAYRGDVLAEKTFNEVGKMLGTAFANIVNILAPEAIVLGGGVVESSDLFLSKAKKAMLKHIASDTVRKRIKIIKGKFGEYAGAIGAAMMIE